MDNNILKSELIEFLSVNNWMSLGDEQNAIKVIDVYINTYKKSDGNCECDDVIETNPYYDIDDDIFRCNICDKKF